MPGILEVRKGWSREEKKRGGWKREERRSREWFFGWDMGIRRIIGVVYGKL
jgi:hypothetical protein